MFIPEIHSFSSDDRACIIPYGFWSDPILDFLAKWNVAVFTCEKEVIDRLQGRTGVFFLPPVVQKTGSSARKKPDFVHEMGLFGDWTNPFESEVIDSFQRFFGDEVGESVYAGRPHDVAGAASCRVVFPVQSGPALSPLILSALHGGAVVLLPESSRSFFPSDLPVHYYTIENWRSVMEKALSDPQKAQNKEWKEAYTARAVEARLKRLIKEHEVSPGRREPVPKDEWGTFLLLVANMLEGRQEAAACEEKLKEAKKIFEECGENLDAAGRNNFGACLVGLEEMERAKENFRKSGCRLSLFNLAYVLFNEGAFSEVSDCLEKCMSQKEDFAGVALGAQNTPEMARLMKTASSREDFSRFVKAGILHLMGLALWKAGKRAEALQNLKEAVSLDPQNPFLLYRLATLYMEKRMVAQPIKIINQALTFFPFFFDAAYSLIAFYCQVELYDQAAAVGEKYLKYPESMNPLKLKMLNQIAYVRLLKGDVDEAIELVKRCLEKDAGNPDLEGQLSAMYLKRGVTAFEQGSLQEALQWAKESLLLDPAQALAINLMGSVSYWKGEFEQASQYFRNAASLNPNLTVAEENMREAEISKGILVSLIVVSHDQPEIASYSLRLLSESSGVPFEIIYLRPSGAKKWDFLESIPNLRQVESEFSGLGQAYNYGAAVARGKHFVFMEDDVLVGKSWLSLLVELLEQEGVGAVGPVTDCCGNSQQMAISSQTDPVEVSVLDGFCMAVRRQLFKEIGGFDERFKVRGYEDRDLSLRIKLRGEKLLCHPGVIVYHRGLLPVLPSNANVSEIDSHNKNAFVEKWESVRSEVSSRV